jgi:hypothetical protein
MIIIDDVYVVAVFVALFLIDSCFSEGKIFELAVAVRERPAALDVSMGILGYLTLSTFRTGAGRFLGSVYFDNINKGKILEV